MFYSQSFSNVVRASALVLTAGRREKKQQRVTLHCDMEWGAPGQKMQGQKNNAALWPEGGINIAG